ncbi:MAG TPA: hypothetical protein VHX17_03430 [Candidatus Cybelea sp.]|nr:hypothetical protein [Candidatus Cybelea sp.]
MLSSIFRSAAPGLAVAAALLAGCSAPAAPLVVPGAMPLQQLRNSTTVAVAKARLNHQGYKATAPLLFVTSLGNTSVLVYRASGKDPKPLATITDGLSNPFGACVDTAGTLYITNEPASGGWVSVYPLGKTKPSRIITDGITGPAYCTIDAKGNLWVANAFGSNVSEYLYGENKPHTVIREGLLEPVGIVFDSSGNLYVGNGPLASQQNIEVYAPKSKSPSRTITNGVTSPCALAFDSNGTLYVANVYQDNVTEYRAGSSDPYQMITRAMRRPEGLAFDRNGKLYVSNESNIVEFAPGSLTPLNRRISKGLFEPNGVAHYPASSP